MMLQRELIRMAAAFLVGALVGLLVVNSSATVSPSVILLIGLHGISVLYGASFCWHLMKKVCGSYFQYSVMGFWMGVSIWKSMLMGVIISCIIAFILFLGWIVGWVRCIYCIVVAIQTDRMYF